MFSFVSTFVLLETVIRSKYIVQYIKLMICTLLVSGKHLKLSMDSSQQSWVDPSIRRHIGVKYRTGHKK
jgi:hypothetical protein